jgi:putative SOS response-associated peptidase YedK
MCGRYGLTIEQEAIAAAFGVERFLTEHRPRFNIAPSQEVPVVVEDARGRRVVVFRWGLVPYFAEHPKVGFRSINARSESVATKPAFKAAWERPRRCLVPADGFYEWQRPDGAEQSSGARARSKIPYWIFLADRRPFALAGLWEKWQCGSEPLFTCTILTTRANALVAPIHDRMPVILVRPEDWNAWIDPRIPSEALEDRLSPYPAEELATYPVSTYVNDPVNEGPACIAEVPGGTLA